MATLGEKPKLFVDEAGPQAPTKSPAFGLSHGIASPGSGCCSEKRLRMGCSIAAVCLLVFVLSCGRGNSGLIQTSEAEFDPVDAVLRSVPLIGKLPTGLLTLNLFW